MNQFHLSQNVHIGSAAIKVNDIEKMIHFYKDIFGFILKNEENNLAILGSKKLNSCILILEEITTLDTVVDQVKKGITLAILVPRLIEFASVYKRFSTYRYPNKLVITQADRLGFHVIDPEGNQLEISCLEKMNHFNDEENLNHQKLMKRGKYHNSPLSEAVIIEGIKLPTKNDLNLHHFYSRILGIGTDNFTENKLKLTSQNFYIQLNDIEDYESVLSQKKEVLGIEFFVMNLKTEQEMQALKIHLERQNQEFFVNKKLTILTINDPLNIEWWFTRDKRI